MRGPKSTESAMERQGGYLIHVLSAATFLFFSGLRGSPSHSQTNLSFSRFDPDDRDHRAHVHDPLRGCDASL